MVKIFILNLILILSSLPIFSQGIEKVEGQYTLYAEKNMSIAEAEIIAVKRAKIQALADAFGTIVSQSNLTTITNINGKSGTNFLSFGESEVKGEWIETIGEPKIFTTFNQETQSLIVKVSIKGKARRINTAKIDIEASIIKNTNDVSESLTLISGEQFYLYFKSPVKGYLTVYMIDENDDAFCLLPYARQEDGNLTIKAGNSYIFFSEENAVNDVRPYVDEYFAFTEQLIEHNRIFILFSPIQFFKANDNSGRFDNTANSFLPRELKGKDFYKWLSKNKRHNTSLQVIEKIITVEKAN